MNITNTCTKSIIFVASILTFNVSNISAVAPVSNDSVESLLDNTKISSLYFAKTNKDSDRSAKIGNKGACNVNPKLCK